jgi:tetratricopeptide (TPR) repeat protein
MAAQNDILSRVAKVLKGSFSPSGDESVHETAETQNENEKYLEELFEDCCKEFGLENAVTIEVFLRLFDVLIGMYRLDRCDQLLKEVLPAIDRLESKSVEGTASSSLSSKYKLKGIQCLAFTRWKQGKLSEAMDLFMQMESLLPQPSPALLENMGHTYSSMGNLDKAKEYFEKSIEAGSPNEGGILLGLGLLSERSGDHERGIQQCLKALEWYENRFSKKGNESSLEAKCCMSIAKLYATTKQTEKAYEYATRAVENFRRTCGNDSPLLASALKAQGEILANDPLKASQAIRILQESLSIEASKDAVDMMCMMDLVHALTKLAQRLTDSGEQSRTYMRTFTIASDACNNVRKKLPKDGNMAAFFKFVAELAIYANQLAAAKCLLEEALPLFQEEKSMDCSGLASQCTEILALIDRRIASM